MHSSLFKLNDDVVFHEVVVDLHLHSLHLKTVDNSQWSRKDCAVATRWVGHQVGVYTGAKWVGGGTFPVFGANRGICIFIASKTTTSWPASTWVVGQTHPQAHRHKKQRRR